MRPKQGTVTVAAAGTRVQFTSSTGWFVRWIRIQAQEGNTGTVYVGDSTVAAATGFALHNGTDGVNNVLVLEPWKIAGSIRLSDLWADAAENGDKVDYFALVD